MTRKEILAMPAGMELDRLIVAHVGVDHGFSCPKCNGEQFSANSGEPFCNRCHWHGPWAEAIPHKYSTDIAAAWAVVEKMVTLGRVFIVKGDGLRSGDHNPKWTVLCANQERVDKNDAPHAICIAALLAVMPCT